MFDEAHIELVRQGPKAIAAWRAEDPVGRMYLCEAAVRGGERFPIGRLYLCGARLHGADLGGADLGGAYLDSANLRGANLRGANLHGADLHGAYLGGANLKWTVLHAAQLIGADLRRADLTGADLGEADLTGADLGEANLSRAIFQWADLDYANLCGANLCGADLSRANCIGTRFGGVDLSLTKGLDTVLHIGPSTIGADTLAASRGSVPDEFLKGCGLAPWEILAAKLYDPTLGSGEITKIVYAIHEERAKGVFRTGLFISYSHVDSKFADKMKERLEEEGFTVWLDRHDLKAGQTQKQIDRAIRLHDIVLLILSEASVESDWVVHELQTARRKEKEQKRDVLCPVALDKAWEGKRHVVEWEHLFTKNVLDFSKWKTKAFERAFEKLTSGIRLNY